jgi:hypothetical protein
MPRLKPDTVVPTPEEDAAITEAAMSDPDARPLTDDEWAAAKPGTRVGRPRMQSRTPRSFNVLTAFHMVTSETPASDASRFILGSRSPRANAPDAIEETM